MNEFILALFANDLLLALIIIVAMRKLKYPFIEITTKVVSMPTQQTLDCTKVVKLGVSLKAKDAEDNQIDLRPEGVSGLEFSILDSDAEFGTIENSDGGWTFNPGIAGAKGTVHATCHYVDENANEFDLEGTAEVELVHGGPAELTIEFAPV